MKTKTANLRRLDIPGNGEHSSDREIFSVVVKQWRQRLGYCSVFAAVPAILASHISEARSGETKKPEASVAERIARRLGRLNMSFSNPALLKRQAEYRLPHQNGNFATPATLAGNDDCPGRTIPAGNYTAAAPYVDSGDTTGASDTVTRVRYYYYYSYEALGPDHVYSFTLTGRGPDPQIEVSTTGTYIPLIYVLQGGYDGACPAGTGNTAFNGLIVSNPNSNIATVNYQQMTYLPLGVPLHLFVDSARNDASGSGPYSIRIRDVTIGPACTNPNPIDCPERFVRQHYIDFLNREPESAGYSDWLTVLNGCGPEQGGLGANPACDRVHVSSGFFRSPEFGERGYWGYRFYESALGRRPLFTEFISETQQLSGLMNEAQLEKRRADFIKRFMQLTEFTNIYSGITDASHATQFIAKLEEKARVTLPASAQTAPGQPPQFGRQQLIDKMQSGQFNPAQTLRAFIEQKVVWDTYFYRAFVAMQYFGYLRRDPEPAGYDDWVDVLTNGRASAGVAPGDYRHLIFGFIYSTEYKARFGK